MREQQSFLKKALQQSQKRRGWKIPVVSGIGSGGVKIYYNLPGQIWQRLELVPGGPGKIF